jgi:hypothetical protein
VEKVRKERQPTDTDAKDRLERWSAWVLALADRIDPIRSGRIPNDVKEAGPEGRPAPPE